MSKQLAFLFVVTKELTFALANVIIGLKRHHSNFDADIIVLHDGISVSDEKILHKIYEKIYLKKISYNDIQERLSKSTLENESLRYFFKRYSYLNIAKFMLFDLVSEYQDVVLLDVDVMIQRPLYDLFNYKPVAWRKTVKPISVHFNCAKYSLPKTMTGPNGGLLYVHSTPQTRKITSTLCFDLLNKFCCDMTGGFDECIISIALHLNAVSANEIDILFNCWPLYKNVSLAYLVHSIGKNKFWNDLVIRNAFPEWVINNEIWLRNGGKEYVGKVLNSNVVKDEPNKYICKAINSEFWSPILQSLKKIIPFFVICPQECAANECGLYLLKLHEEVNYKLVNVTSQKKIIIFLACIIISAETREAVLALFETIKRQIGHDRCNVVINNDKASISIDTDLVALHEMFLKLVSLTYRELYRVFLFKNQSAHFTPIESNFATLILQQ